MKEIKAFIRRSQSDQVVHALRSSGVRSMSLIAVEGIGELADPSQAHLSTEYVACYSEVYKIELVCREEDADRIIEMIREKASTGDPGDGAIFVSSIERAVKIRSGDQGPAILDRVDAPEGA